LYQQYKTLASNKKCCLGERLVNLAYVTYLLDAHYLRSS